MSGAQIRRVVAALSMRGVDFNRKHGGVCPLCGKKKAKIVRSMAWEGETRERYHKCKCGFSFKSIESVTP